MSLLLTALLRSSLAFAGALPDVGEVAGTVGSEVVAQGDSLIEMARRHDLGFAEIAAANPGLDPFVPAAGTRVVLPTAWIVPQAPAGMVLVNLSEMRLYLHLERKGDKSLVTFPIGVGVDGHSTPAGDYRVVAKEKNPTWHVPPSVRKDEPELPPSVPPGKDNPLGTRALRLSGTAILIHGTNRPFGVGRRVSHGCMRLYPEDILVLYRLVPVGATVRVVRQPVKVALWEDRIYVEVHQDDEVGLDLLEEARRLLARRGLLDRVDRARLEAAVRQASGAPVDVGR